MNHFQVATPQYVQPLINQRPGEVKLGERLQLPSGNDLAPALAASSARFVLVGIPEDIGVRANGGTGGAHTAWEPALKALVNIQSTDLLKGDELLLLGAFDFGEWMQESEGADLAQLRRLVARIDEAVYPVIAAIVAAGKMPIAIGGGHNNAFPLLKGTSLALGRPLSCVNLDAHSDYRIAEGRHSGNGFRYAQTEGYLERYAMVGLHRNYNSQAVLADLRADPALHHSFYEDIFLIGTQSFEQSVADALRHAQGAPTGIELDLDCIEQVLSSAATPCGIPPLQARQYLHQCARSAQVAYLHITEGAAQLRDGRSSAGTGKLIAYLVSDFIRSHRR